MLKLTISAFGIGWVLVGAVAFGYIAQDSRLGFGPLVLLGAATIIGLMAATEDKEQRTPLLLLAAAAFGSCLFYGVLRYFMLFAWASR